MKRNAFTLMELMIGIMILAITATIVIVNVNAVGGHSAKIEAEKLAHWLTSRMSIADSKHKHFYLLIDNGQPVIWWGDAKTTEQDKEYFEMSKGCTFTLNVTELEYYPKTNVFSQGGNITVTGKGTSYKVVIAAIGGRINVEEI